MTYPPPPPPSSAMPPGRLRGRTQLQLAAFLGIPGLLLLIVGIVLFATTTLSKVDGFQRVTFAQGTATLTFHPGDYIAYYEVDDLTNGTRYDVAVAIRGTGGGPVVHLTRYDGPLTYDYHGHRGTAVFDFHISRAGRYDVQVQDRTGVHQQADMAFGTSIAAGTIAGALLTVLGLGLLIAGIVLLIVGLVRRGRHKRQLAGTPPGYGQPGYGPPGYGQPGYGPPQPDDGPPQSGDTPPSLRKHDPPPWPPREG